MRELRKDVESTLDSPKEELVDNIDEMKIEEVLMGLKGLKQEEVFSFLGKNNFTPAETEEWLKMMTSAGFGNYDHLTGVDSSDMEQLQLNFDSNFDGFQGSQGHISSSFMQKTASLSKITDSKFKHNQKTCFQSSNPVESFNDWVIKKDRNEETGFVKQENGIKLPSLDFRRTSSVWPKCPGAPITYSLADGEEEIISTPMNEVSTDIIHTDNLQEDFKYPDNNTYVIQSSGPTETVEVPDKPKPIKLLIKRVENEEEIVATNFEPSADNLREKSKRIRNPCPKRKFMESSPPPPKRKRCLRKPPIRTKEKSDSSVPKKKEESYEEFDFPFAATVHQDDEFVYPSLELSDDEEDDIYSFNQRDDETWTPKIKMKINEVKTERPTRDRKTKSAVAKCLEAAAMKRADSDVSDDSSTRKKCIKKCPKKKESLQKAKISISSMDSNLSLDSDVTGDLVIDDSVSTSKRNVSFNNLHTAIGSNSQLDNYPVPSTSSNYVCPTTSSSFRSNEVSLESSDTSPESSPAKPKKSKLIKSKARTAVKNKKIRTKLIPPKTCKLIQTPPGTSAQSAKRPVKEETSEKKTSSSYVTKRGKPKKGMATAKQRLGKILKMHKMFF